MRRHALVFLVVLGTACGGETATTTPGDPLPPGDPGSATGDATAGDVMPGDPGQGDALPGDAGGGDPAAAVITPSTQLCASGGKVSSASYRGRVCLSPLGGGGQVSTSSSYKWIPGPAHILEAE